MRFFEYCRLGDNIVIEGRQYRAGDLLISYMNLGIERLDALYSACLAQKNALLRFERSEEYSRVIHRCADTFNVIDKVFSRLSPYNRLAGENHTLISIMEKSPLFRGFDVVSAQSEHIEEWRRECAGLADMYLSALDGLKFCRDIAVPFLTELEESDSAEKAFAALSADAIELIPAADRLMLVEAGGEKKLCKGRTCKSFLSFVQDIFSMALFAEVRPRPCGSCGKYFLPSNRLAKFCDRKAPDGSGKLCREVGARRRYEKKQKDNPISAAYTRVYKARYARMTNGKLTKDEMSHWTAKAVELRARAIAEDMPCDEFEQMLREL